MFRNVRLDLTKERRRTPCSTAMASARKAVSRKIEVTSCAPEAQPCLRKAVIARLFDGRLTFFGMSPDKFAFLGFQKTAQPFLPLASPRILRRPFHHSRNLITSGIAPIASSRWPNNGKLLGRLLQLHKCNSVFPFGLAFEQATVGFGQ